MNKLFIVILFGFVGAVQAQTFPVNNLAVSGTSSFAGPSTFNSRPLFNGNVPYDTGNISTALTPYAPLNSPAFSNTLGLTGSITAPITVPGASAKFLSKPTPTGQQIYTGICGGCTSYDQVQSTITVPNGTTVTGTNGFGSYINDLNGTGTPGSGNSVNYFGVNTCSGTNAACWGINTVLIDNTAYLPSTLAGVQLNVAEFDVDVTSPHTNVQGPTITGSSLVQPAFAQGFTIGSLSVQDRSIAKFNFGFVTEDGVSVVAAHYGASEISGTNVSSQPVTQNYFDNTGTVRQWSTQVSPSGNLNFSDTGTGHSAQVNGNFIINGATHAITHTSTIATGTAAPVLSATKPGSTTTVATWMSVIIDGAQFWMPVWGN